MERDGYGGGWRRRAMEMKRDRGEGWRGRGGGRGRGRVREGGGEGIERREQGGDRKGEGKAGEERRRACGVCVWSCMCVCE